MVHVLFDCSVSAIRHYEGALAWEPTWLRGFRPLWLMVSYALHYSLQQGPKEKETRGTASIVVAGRVSARTGAQTIRNAGSRFCV